MDTRRTSASPPGKDGRAGGGDQPDGQPPGEAAQPSQAAQVAPTPLTPDSWPEVIRCARPLGERDGTSS